MGMTLYFCLIVIVTVLCTSESDAVHQLGGEYASHNPDWQHSFGATRDSHTTNATDVTYDLFSCAVTVIFYGRNLVPVKRIGSGDVNATGMPIVTTGSLSLGLLLWASFNMLIGWASTSMFLEIDCRKIKDDQSPMAADGFWDVLPWILALCGRECKSCGCASPPPEHWGVINLEFPEEKRL
ncbi:hypothetical protein AALO_G00002140 [Alosa alosa]|uniref:Uncharacterized protein n=1 Tax=Alosa alosa TaxID=278164 RepID=A0AAV6HFR9_9TELE|nr:hypothetical protein AALO_G00002140 [Alosa alosa]